MVVESDSASRRSESVSPYSGDQFLLGRVGLPLGSLAGGTSRFGHLPPPPQVALSINMRELLAVHYGLQALEHLLVGRSVALFCDNATTVAYLSRFGGIFSPALISRARDILLWADANFVSCPSSS